MNYNSRLREIWHRYLSEVGEPATVLDVIRWGERRGMLVVPTPDPYAKVTEDLSRALREETRVDPETGLRYRVNHAVTITKAGGIQRTMWADLNHADHDFMQKAFEQRRAQIAGDCKQLMADIQVYNSRHPGRQPIQMSFDFTAEVECFVHSRERSAA